MQDQKRVKPPAPAEGATAVAPAVLPDISQIQHEITEALGQSISIRIGQMPGGKIQTLILSDDKSLEAAAREAGFNLKSFEIQIRGLTPDRAMSSPTMQTQLVDGDLVLLVEKIQGNSAEKKAKEDTETKLKLALAHAQEVIQDQQEILRSYASPPLSIGTILQINEGSEADLHVGEMVRLKSGEVGRLVSFESKDKALVKNTSNGLLETWVLADIESPTTTATIVVNNERLIVNKPSMKISPGMTVGVNQFKQIVSASAPQLTGTVRSIKQVLDQSRVEVEHDGSTHVVRTSIAVEEGDRVIMDPSGSIAVINLGKSDHQFVFSQETNITWEDIGGQGEAKQLMKRAIEMPYQNIERYRFYNKQAPKGVLLYGPPGNGKTMLGKAAATSLAKTHNQASSRGFFYVKGPEILNKWVGETERIIRQLFSSAREHKAKEGYPAVLLIDEADAILSQRGIGRSSDMERTIVPMFLAEMDGLEESGALIILATNRPDQLDPAITRDGRVDLKIRVSSPDFEDAQNIFQIYLKKVPLQETLSKMVEHATKMLFADSFALYSVKTKQEEINITLGSIASGAMIANIVDLATSEAIDREIASGVTSAGLMLQDLDYAVQRTYEQNQDLNHQDILTSFMETLQDEVVSVQRA